jgi:hypothetical protein
MVVEDFSCRTITFEEYTFPGISGLAKEVQRHTGYEYGAVIRTHDFHNGLLWLISGFGSPSSTYWPLHGAGLP